MMKQTAEHKRLDAHRARQANWKLWGPYLSERAWGTVREDYSAGGEAWDFFPHDHARSRTYRWNEDGLAGISDRNQYLCFAVALWNGRDPILKERMFGLTGGQGNHGEDVKEYYFYLDSTPTHSHMQMLYKYPHTEYPYDTLVDENGQRGYFDFEYELLDTGAFNDNRYFDLFVEYDKADENDLLITITAINRGPEAAPLHILPTLWFRNTWSWGYDMGSPMGDVNVKPNMSRDSHAETNGTLALKTEHHAMPPYYFYAENAADLLFTENETNVARLFGLPNETPHVKDSFHRYIVNGETEAVNRDEYGTKAAAVYQATIPAGGEYTIRLRLSESEHKKPFADFAKIRQKRIDEANDFYQAVQNPNLDEDERRVQRQALAGMLWSKQLYYYDVGQWLKGDPGPPTPPTSRYHIRNQDWKHMANFDVVSMPDKWEYPWYAVWDLAFHCLPLALVDPDFAKRQLLLFTREWYMHPNGQLPAYEWNFGDVNPPVHAWATLRVFQMDAELTGKPDYAFLEAVYHKLLLNFTWWVNRKDAEGRNLFQGGFLGLDNISVFDRSHALPTGGYIDQSDGTSWMAAFCLTMLKMSFELAKQNPTYQDMATKFFEHFLQIAHAMSSRGHDHHDLWDEADGFFYDSLNLPDGQVVPLKVRSLVGLLPLFAVEILDQDLLDQMPIFRRRMEWFFDNNIWLRDEGHIACVYTKGMEERHLFAILNKERLQRIVQKMLDETEFLSDYGIRSVSKFHKDNPYTYYTSGEAHTVNYQPAESESSMFGGNSNWRGPIWFPINFLLVEALQKFDRYYDDSLMIECPTGSKQYMSLGQAGEELARRLILMFLRNESGQRPIYGGLDTFQNDPHWRDLILFNEYFHGDNGAGLGASHQTGWTGLVAQLLQQHGGQGKYW